MQNADLTVEQELADFEAGRLDAAAFPHSEHLRLGFEMLGWYSFAETLQRFSTGVKLLAAKQGKPEVYHETKTVAFLSLIAERRQRGGEQTWEQFIAANPDLANKRYLESLYRAEELESDTARAIFVLPKRERLQTSRSLVAFNIVFVGYIIWSSGMTLASSHGHDNHIALLAGTEIVAALLFCFRRTRALGLVLLLSVFSFAAVVEFHLGHFPVRFVYYAASALLVWWVTPRLISAPRR